MSANYSQSGIGVSVEYSQGGARVKDNTGVIEIRDNADAVFTQCRGADPIIADDLATKRYVDALVLGEVNTASNIGTGEGVFSAKVGTDLEFKSLTSSDASITISASATEIDLTTAGGGGGITPAQHETLRQLIHFIDDGPGNGFTTGALKETLPAGVPFPTQFIWWESAAKTNKIVELQITRNPNQTPATELWTMYSGGAPVGTVSDTITYAANVFEVSRTRAIAP